MRGNDARIQLSQSPKWGQHGQFSPEQICLDVGRNQGPLRVLREEFWL
jgi:hypothetical protein